MTDQPTDKPKAKRKSSKRKTLEFLLANMGRVLEWQEIREAAGNVEQWSRRSALLVKTVFNRLDRVHSRHGGHQGGRPRKPIEVADGR